ncbi:hypothetical protein HRI_001272000 [Hibiscus trionum]|uniref:Endonuclease/exonuclease/phosphatase domain-containing protein n=1 Tax=Hibiscus trionum TaxID=183268 RepID=A0A9W7HEL2_HIBTR|nr:hypothetical protein HRI_001272000 [Hibiscus trionum]
MSIISWNVRGLGKPRAVNCLRNSLRGIHPQFLLLMETKLSARRMERVRHKCGFRFGIDVAAVGSRGGLSFGWKPESNVHLRSYSKHHIDVEIHDDDNGPWRLIGFYGNPVEQSRPESWDLLRQLATDQSLPWIVVGDFNEILYSFEKNGGRQRSTRNMALFQDTLVDCDLTDLGFKGVWYTWEHGRLATNNIRERLDRAVANPSWWERFPEYSVTHLSHTISDHCPLRVESTSSNGHSRRKLESGFRFEASWVLEDDIEHTIQ